MSEAENLTLKELLERICPAKSADHRLTRVARIKVMRHGKWEQRQDSWQLEVVYVNNAVLTYNVTEGSVTSTSASMSPSPYEADHRGEIVALTEKAQRVGNLEGLMIECIAPTPGWEDCSHGWLVGEKYAVGAVWKGFIADTRE
jgi:hypothetical protein